MSFFFFEQLERMSRTIKKSNFGHISNIVHLIDEKIICAPKFFIYKR